MADDDNDKRRKGPGPQPAGARPFVRRSEGKPGFAGKPQGQGKKPFVKRRDETIGEGPKRDFRTPRGDRAPGGFKGRKPFERRAERPEGAEERSPRTFEKRQRPEGDRKPFRKGDRTGAGPRPGRRERAAESDAPSSTFKRGANKDRRPISPFEGEMAAKRSEGGSAAARGAKKASRPAATTSPGRFAATLPSRGREGDELSERIAKRLARAGIASRRDAEALIADGRVKVNGQVLTSPAFNVSASDRIEVDGTEIPPVERTRLFLFHKPAGVVTTSRDPEGRRTVFDVLPKDLPRLITVGRLDINTEGLLLLTNDGGLARLLELPSTGWLRRYRVRVHGTVDETALAGLREGIAVDGVFYGSVEASLDREQGTNAWLTIGLREGKNREVKNILGALGLDVTRLIRVSYGPFQLGDLAEGAVQELRGRTLRDQLGERLIEEAGANFDAPVVKPFSNKPVGGADEARPERAERPKIVRDGIRGKIGEGGLIKQRRRDRPDERASALSRLTTKPDKGWPFAKGGKGKPFAKRGDKPDERTEPARARTSNVWMAPGARPQGKSETLKSPSPRSRGEGKGEGRRFGGKKEAGNATTGHGDDSPSSALRAPSPRKRGEGKGKGAGGADRRR